MSERKSTIMTISTGRSGTGLLTELLGLASDISSVHEPAPTFQDIFEEGMAGPQEALAFTRDTKLPAIAACGTAHYAETSHYFGQGFLDAFMELGTGLKVIVLNREPRGVAKSFERIKCVPVKTAKGRSLMPHPGTCATLPVEGWEDFSDYQLCYWYCLETEMRKEMAKARTAAVGVPLIEVALDELLDFTAFSGMMATLGLRLREDSEARHKEITATKVNRKGKYMPRLRVTGLDGPEAAVWAAVNVRHPELRAAVESRYQDK